MLIDITSGLNTQQVKRIIELIGEEITGWPVTVTQATMSGREPVCCHLFSISFSISEKELEKMFKIKETAMFPSRQRRRR